MVAIQWDSFHRSSQTDWKGKMGEVCGGFAGNVFVEAVAISSDQLPAAAVSAAAAPVQAVLFIYTVYGSFMTCIISLSRG